ncbi:MAG: glycosyl hydrolase [Cytophagales bacterium]|nr:MAG: glycosyl hydrolase [Cytophagales bacterium]
MKMLLKTTTTIGLVLAIITIGYSQDLQQAIKQKEQMRQSSAFAQYPARNIGPTIMGGRIVDIAVNSKDPKNYYVAYASGGVFKTNNNGVSFMPIFDNQARLTVGDIAVAESNPNILWVGTGENNSSRSSYAGYGVFKSEDGGKTWQHMGLENTQHIGRIIIHPTDPNTVWVASIGALYTNNKERGIYKTTDGGKTWQQTLNIAENAGVIDLIINPKDPKQLWAAAWQRSRKAWDFEENGEGSGLHYSEDGGNTWTKITNGLPNAPNIGRIGLDICASQPNVLYLVMDNQTETKVEKKNQTGTGISFRDFENMTNEAFFALKDEDLNNFLKEYEFPKKYTAEIVKQEVKAGKYTPKALSDYVKSDANSDLFTTQINGAEVYRSDDSGKSWRKVNTYNLDGVFFTYGYYFGQIRVSPNNPEQIYILGYPLLRSDDGGKTYTSIATNYNEVHADHHALWINAQDDNHILLGNDGGLYASYDKGDNFMHLHTVPVGQFYTVTVDMEQPYNVYGGLQDNGVYYGSSKSVPNETKDWESIMGGDGMYVAVDPRNSNTIYTGYQFGNYYRIRKKEDQYDYITPKHDIGQQPYRFNWRTPVILSKHNADILYMGSQKVLRSMNQGTSWEAISPDLTQQKNTEGNVPFATITSLAESPFSFGLLYAGTDDGQVQVSKDGGANWELINNGLPQNKWVSSVFPSPHDKATVFVTLNGYRQDETYAYLYKSTDFGKNWTSLKANLPEESVNILIQDPVNPEVLYVGTDLGAYISIDGGTQWHLLNQIPNVAVYDMVVHPRENELVVATHGRSMYIIDVKNIQTIKNNNSQSVQLFDIGKVRYNEQWGKAQYGYLKPRIPNQNIQYYLGTTTAKNAEITIVDSNNKVVRTLMAAKEKGFYTLAFDLKNDKGEYLKKGEYKVTLTQEKNTHTKNLKIE